MQDRIGIDQYGVSVGCKARSGSRLVVKRGPMTVSDLLVDAGVDHGCGKLKLHRPRAISRSLIGDLAAPHDRAPRWAVSRPIVIHDLFAVLLRTAGRFVNCFDFWNCPAFCCASSVAHRPTPRTSPFRSKHPTARRCMLAVVCTSYSPMRSSFVAFLPAESRSTPPRPRRLAQPVVAASSYGPPAQHRDSDYYV